MEPHLFALVERSHAQEWFEVSRWSLGKDYSLMRALETSFGVVPNWPRHTSLSLDERGSLSVGHWASPDVVLALKVELAYRQPLDGMVWKSLLASLGTFPLSHTLRIVFWKRWI